MKVLLNEALTVDGFGCVHVEIVEWYKQDKLKEEQTPNDSALIGISLKGESVSSETGYKSIQGFSVSDYSQFEPRQFAEDFILSRVHTTPLLSSTSIPTNTNIDSSSSVTNNKKCPEQMSFPF